MNNKLSEFARQELKNGLAQLPKNWQIMFARMYSPDDLDKPIVEIVNSMPDIKLDWALQQVMNSLKKQEELRKMGAVK